MSDPNPAAGSAEDLPIVVGVDGSDESVAALQYATQLSEALGHRLTAIAAWNFPPDMSGFLPPELDLADDTQQMADETIERAFAGDPPAGFDIIVHRGSPAQVLIDAGETAAMIVVGSRGHGGFRGMLLGSVSRAVAAHAKCPVMVHHGQTSV